MANALDGLLIVNPTAGRGRARKQWGWRWTGASGDAERMAREAAQAGGRFAAKQVWARDGWHLFGAGCGI